MNDTTKVSIIVPVANGPADLLNKAIESIIKQTYKNIEVIVVLNEPSDEAVNVINKYKKKDKRVSVVKSKKGVSNARNRGLDCASGNYISFIDADDWIELDFIDNLLNKLLTNSADCVLCACYYDYEGHYDQTCADKNKSCQKSTSQEIRSSLLTQKFIRPDVEVTSVWGGIYKKELIADTRFLPTLTIAEDFLFQYSIFSKNATVLIMDDHEYHYLIRNSSVMKNGLTDEKMHSFKILVGFMETLKDNVVSHEEFQLFKSRLVSLAFSLLLMSANTASQLEYRVELQKFIKRHRRDVLKIKNLRLQLKLAVISSLFGFRISKKIISLIRSI